MKKERNIPDFEQGSLKENPFTVPEGYFESFPGRLAERIRSLEEERVPVRRLMASGRIRIAIAAAILGLALLSYPVIRMMQPGNGDSAEYFDYALLEGADLFTRDYEMAGYLEEESATLDDEEAFLNQAIDYLAMNNMDMDLIFE